MSSIKILLKILLLLTITKISAGDLRFEYSSVPVISLVPKHNEYIMEGYKNNREIGYAYYKLELDAHKKKILILGIINIREGHQYIGHEESFIENLKKLAQANNVKNIFCQERMGSIIAKIHLQCGARKLHEKDDFIFLEYKIANN